MGINILKSFPPTILAEKGNFFCQCEQRLFSYKMEISVNLHNYCSGNIDINDVLYIVYLTHLSIYLLIPLKGDNQNQILKVQEDITLNSPSPSLLVKENTEERLPKPIVPSLLLNFYNQQGTWWQFSCSPHYKALIILLYCYSLVHTSFNIQRFSIYCNGYFQGIIKKDKSYTHTCTHKEVQIFGMA